jgi:UDP-glucuronate decarboxylase
MATILVTGGAGFIGSCLAERLAEDKTNHIVIADNLLTGEKEKLPQAENITFYKADVNNEKQIHSIFSKHSFDYIFHYAAVVGVKRTQTNPLMVLDDINGFRHLLELSRESKVKRIYFSSSSEVYGEPAEFPQNEYTTPLNSRVPYAIVKNLGEAYFRSYQKEYGLEFTIFRFFNTYGPKQSTDFVMSRFLALALGNHDITIYGDGSQTRTFCYIDDNLDATLAAFTQNKMVNDVVNIGNDLETPIIDLAQIIIRLTGSKSKIVHLPALEEGDMSRRKPDISKMRTLLNRPLLPLEEGIRKLLADRRFIIS